MDVLVAYSGAIASIWIVVGIFVVSLFYPNYSHSQQFCSELGATGSPTQKLSPVVNNYPLGLLFILFGYHVAISNLEHIATLIIGSMIILHGLGTWVAGYFPMDKNPYIASPTPSCKIHSWAGLVMLMSFIIAPAIVCFSAYPLWFRLFSVLCILGTILFTLALAKAFKAKSNPGFHQRLSYGFQILWLFIYSFVMVQ